MNHHALRLTPSNSPFHKTTASPRSPTRFPKPDEPGLQLRHVIGTTTSSSTAFDCLPSSRLFAHTAGACAVLAEVKATDGLTVKQRFYRARPAPTGTTRDGGATPTPGDPRHRALGYVREQSVGGSPLASSRDWSDSPAGRSTTAKDRVKAATSVPMVNGWRLEKQDTSQGLPSSASRTSRLIALSRPYPSIALEYMLCALARIRNIWLLWERSMMDSSTYGTLRTRLARLLYKRATS
jgi:hypothetical protein